MKVLRTGILALAVLFLMIGICYAQSAEECYNKGIEYGVAGKFEKAQQEFKKALEVDPFYGKAKVCLELVEDALKQRIKPETALHIFKGADYGLKGMYDETIAEFKRAIEINPNYAEAHNNLAVAYYYKEEYSLAIKHCDRAIELGLRPHPGFLEALKPYR